MNTILLYFILANIGITAFYLFFRLFLHRDTFFREKRVALLVGMLFAIAYPLVDVSGWLEKSEKVVVLAQNLRSNLPDVRVDLQDEYNYGSSVAVVGDDNMDTSNAHSVVVPPTSSMVTFTWFDWTVAVYLLVVTIFLFRVLRQLIRMLLWMRQSECVEWNGQRFYRLPKGIAPFSFFKAVFLNPETYSESDLEEILQHEWAHVRQGHTYDVLFSELVCVLCWFNPFAWLLKRRIRENLEFLADQDVLHKGFNPTTYQYHLLQLSCQGSDANLANHFNVSQLKKRIVMMNKKRTSWASLSKYTLSIPLFAALLLTAYAMGQENTEKAKALIAKTINESALLPLLALDNSTKVDTPSSDSERSNTKTLSESRTKQIPDSLVYFRGNDEKWVVYAKPDQEAKFPGGMNIFLDILRSQLKYPAKSILKGEQGAMTILFVVNEWGQSSFNTVRLIDASPADMIIFLGELSRATEALKYRWKPAVHNNKKVASMIPLTVVFHFEGEAPPTNELMMKNCIVVTAKRDRDAEIAYKDTGVFTKADVMPQFPGGRAALFQYLKDKIETTRALHNEPLYTKEYDKQPMYIYFTVSKTGELRRVRVSGSSRFNPIYVTEAIRIVSDLPKWTPGVLDGKKVDVELTIPVIFDNNYDPTQKITLISDGNFSGFVVLDGKIVNPKSFDSPIDINLREWEKHLYLKENQLTMGSISSFSSPMIVNADQPFVHNLLILSTDTLLHYYSPRRPSSIQPTRQPVN